MMKKEEKEGAFDLKKKSCEMEAPKMQRMVPRMRTRGVRVGSEVSSVSGTTCNCGVSQGNSCSTALCPYPADCAAVD